MPEVQRRAEDYRWGAANGQLESLEASLGREMEHQTRWCITKARRRILSKRQ